MSVFVPREGEPGRAPFLSRPQFPLPGVLLPFSSVVSSFAKWRIHLTPCQAPGAQTPANPGGPTVRHTSKLGQSNASVQG